MMDETQRLEDVIRRVVVEMGIVPESSSSSSSPSSSSSSSLSSGTATGSSAATPTPTLRLRPATSTATTADLPQPQPQVHFQVQARPAPPGSRVTQWPMPSVRARGRRRSAGPRMPVQRTVSKDIVLLPYTPLAIVPIPRGRARQALAEAGYTGRVCLWRGQTAEEVKAEVSSVFSSVGGGGLLNFDFLCCLPGSGKKLQRPQVSSSYTWGGTEVLSGQGQGSLYAMLAPQYGIRYEEFFSEDNGPERKRARFAADEESSDEDLPAVNLRAAHYTPTTIPSTSPSTSYEAYVQLVDSEYPEPDEPDGHLQEAGVPLDYVVLTHSDEKLLQEDLDSWREQQVTGDGTPNHLYVRRRHLLVDTLRGFRDGAVKDNQTLAVNFIGESGVDTGGLTRELFSLVLPMIRDSGIFEGSHGRMLPAKNSAGIANGEVKNVGKVLGAAILHGRARLDFLNPVIGNLLCSGEPSDLAIDLLPDASVKDLVKRMKAAPDQVSLHGILDEGDILEEIGWRKLVTMDNRHEVIKAICYHHLLNKRKGELDALMQGMEFWGIKLFAETHPVCIHTVFSPRRVLDANDVFAYFNIEYSIEGSNSREEEEMTTMFFIGFLQKCSSKDPEVEGLTLEDFLQFFCGARSPPLGGFSPTPVLAFHNQRLPQVSTCALELRLSRKSTSVSAFISDLVFGIKNAPGFGQV